MGLVCRHFLNGDNGTAKLLVQLCHLGQNARPLIDTQIIRQQHTEGFVSNQCLAGKDGMPKAFHLPLAHCREHTFVQYISNTGKRHFLTGPRDLVLQFIADIEVIGDGAFATAGDHGASSHACGDRFLHPVLHQRLIHHRQHFLGHTLGGRQKPGAVSGHGKQAFLNQGIYSPTGIRLPSLVAAIHIFKPHDIILTQVGSGLHFDNFQRNMTGVCQSVFMA